MPRVDLKFYSVARRFDEGFEMLRGPAQWQTLSSSFGIVTNSTEVYGLHGGITHVYVPELSRFVWFECRAYDLGGEVPRLRGDV